LVSDSNNIIANPKGKVFGTIIEAEIDKSKGVLATLLIQNGTLRTGNFVLAGNACGRIRAMFDYRGKKIDKAGPSTPVQVMGLGDVPHAGDLFQVFRNEKQGRQIAEQRQEEEQARKNQTPKATLEELFANFQAGEVQELRLIIKADVEGSLEPVVSSLEQMKNEDIKLNILHAQTGSITESDIMLAAASNAIVIGFNVQADAPAKRLAETERISIRSYNIIYRLTEDIEKALKGMLEPEYEKVDIGKAEILDIFRISKVGNIAGCRVLQGEIRRNARVKIMRGTDKIFDGEIGSLRHEKDVVREVRQGFECGISFKGFNDFEIGDLIECYVSMEKKF
jgi:translation initiation factor IF-2